MSTDDRHDGIGREDDRHRGIGGAVTLSVSADMPKITVSAEIVYTQPVVDGIDYGDTRHTGLGGMPEVGVSLVGAVTMPKLTVSAQLTVSQPLAGSPSSGYITPTIVSDDDEVVAIVMAIMETYRWVRSRAA